ncbi:MAG: haloacid dehalogenase-like hydrolase [Phycisphaerae bacterium]|nr:haloacid dehalogenase-like hydrolase [Phycisphaerae bacterium]
MESHPHLVLFDIDGTLLRSQGAGIAAMQRTFDELYPGSGATLKGVPVAGRLDTLIWNDVMREAGLAASDAEMARFRQRYRAILEERLRGGDVDVVTFPGVHDLVRRLAARNDVIVGLLTGNWPDTARLKVEAARFDATHFRLGAYAGDGPDRRSLPPVAMRRMHEAHGMHPRPERVVIIGDTPHDVDCAKHNGCRALAVATGGASLQELHETNADLVVETLADVEAMERWMVGEA